MSNPAHQRLLAYVIGACDDHERAQIEQELQQDEALRKDAELLGRAVAPLACDREHLDSPPGLAQRCCEYVYSRVEVMPAALSPVGEAVAAGHGRRRWSWLDLSVAAAIAVAVLFLIAPAVYQSRQQSLRIACQNNMKDIGTALASYSNRHGGYYPTPPRHGRMANAGMWAPALVSAGDLAEDKLLCPSAPASCKSESRIPKMQECETMTDEQLRKLLPKLGGGLGHTLPYRDGDEVKPHQNQNRRWFVIVSDLPGPSASHSPNHGGDGQNVLFEDGRVIYLKSVKPNGQDDDIFRNADGEVAPGKHCDDTVIPHPHVRIGN